MAHTPGPWKWIEDDDDTNLANGCAWRLEGYSGPPVINVNHFADGPRKDEPPWLEMSTANARLIAAAPDLLQALQDIANNLAEPCAVSQDRQQWMMRKLNDTLYSARAAIAKATGAPAGIAWKPDNPPPG